MRAATYVLSLLGFVIVWAVASLIARTSTLPPPWAVVAFVIEDMLHGDMLFNIAMTLWRATASFIIAMIVGCGLGFVFGRSERADRAFMPWILVLLNTPVLVIAALCYIWFRTTEMTAVLAVVLSKFPNNTVIIRDGVRAFDPALDEIGTIYRFSLPKRFLHILLPQSMPFLMAAARSGIGIVWKIVLVVEFFGLSNGVGFEISKYFGLFEVKEIIGYSVAFSLVMLAVEVLLLQPLDDHARRWRSTSLLEVDIRPQVADKRDGATRLEVIEEPDVCIVGARTRSPVCSALPAAARRRRCGSSSAWIQLVSSAAITPSAGTR